MPESMPAPSGQKLPHFALDFLKITPLTKTKSHSSTVLGLDPKLTKPSLFCLPPSTATCEAAAFPLCQPEGRPWCLIITTDKMRCHPNLKLFYCSNPRNLYCCHPSKPSPHFTLCETAPPPPFPPPHTLFSPTLLKICLPVSTRRSAWTLQSQDTISWQTTFSFLLPPHLPTTPLRPPASSFFPAGSFTCPPGPKAPCCAGTEPETLGREFFRVR